MRSSYTIPIAIVLGGLLVAVAVYAVTPKRPSTGTGNPAMVRPVGAQDHIFGNPDAPVMIVEYSDYDCEFCKDFDETLHQVIANAGVHGQVAWVFRQFPLTEIHPDALKHAEAAECAALADGNDAFWKFSDLLFANQPADPAKYGAYAQQAGVPSEAFSTCFMQASTTVLDRINADRENAFAVGAQGTPYSLILVAGKPPVVIGSAYPYEIVQALVDEALKGTH